MCMRYVLSMLAVLCLTIYAATPVLAQFSLGIGASEATQILNHGELVNQYLRQGEQLAEALKQTADMIRNSQILTTQAYGPIMNDLNQLSQIVQGGRALAYSLANLD